MIKEKPAVCLWCKKEFISHTSKGRWTVTCGRSCTNRLNASKSNVNRNFGEITCPICKKVFISRAKNQVYCTKSCQLKAMYSRNIESHRKRDRIKISKQRIGLNIRDEHLQQPTPIAKWIWNGVGRWAPHFPDVDYCLECNTTTYQHESNGICAYCYDKLRPRDEEKVKEWKKRSYERAKLSGHKFSRTVAKEWIERAQKEEIPITPKISNLLDNLQKL